MAARVLEDDIKVADLTIKFDANWARSKLPLFLDILRSMLDPAIVGDLPHEELQMFNESPLMPVSFNSW
jgi:hypothetical protein